MAGAAQLGLNLDPPEPSPPLRAPRCLASQPKLPSLWPGT